MPLVTTLEGGRIIDPRFLPLPKGPLGMPTLPSPTPPEELEEGKIPLQLEEEPKMPPPTTEEELVLSVPPLVEDLAEGQEYRVALEVHPVEEQTAAPMSNTTVSTQAPIVELSQRTQETISSRLSGCSIELGSSFERPTPKWLIQALKAGKT